MAASTDRPSQAPMTTKVTDMPPMTVTTESIPAAEHVEVAPPPVADRERRTRWIALALSGVLALAAVVALVLGAVLTTPSAYQQRTVLTPPRAGQVPVVAAGYHTVDWTAYRAGERAYAPADVYMGMSPSAWRDYRAGEQAFAPSNLHMGLSVPAWQDYRSGERVA